MPANSIIDYPLADNANAKALHDQAAEDLMDEIKEIPSNGNGGPNDFRPNTITSDDLKTLQPKHELNDVIMNAMRRHFLCGGGSNLDNRIQILSTYFFTQLCSEGAHAVKGWTRKSPFEANIIMIPVNEARHWTLLVVLSPSLVKDLTRKKSCCILHYDSIGPSQEVTDSRSTVIRMWLNSQYQETYKSNDEPFQILSCPAFAPLCETQEESSNDCGVFVLLAMRSFCQIRNEELLEECAWFKYNFEIKEAFRGFRNKAATFRAHCIIYFTKLGKLQDCCSGLAGLLNTKLESDVDQEDWEAMSKLSLAIEHSYAEVWKCCPRLSKAASIAVTEDDIRAFSARTGLPFDFVKAAWKKYSGALT